MDGGLLKTPTITNSASFLFTHSQLFLTHQMSAITEVREALCGHITSYTGQLDLLHCISYCISYCYVDKHSNYSKCLFNDNNN